MSDEWVIEIYVVIFKRGRERESERLREQERFHLCEAQACSSTCTQNPILHNTHMQTHQRTRASHANPAPLPLRHSLRKRERRRDSREGERSKKWIQRWSVSSAGFTLPSHPGKRTLSLFLFRIDTHPKVLCWKWLSDCFFTKTLSLAEKQTMHLSGYHTGKVEIDFTYNTRVHLVHSNVLYL